MKNIFWRYAAQAGTILGLTMAGIQLLHDTIPGAAYTMWTLHYVVFIALLFGFTRNIARKANPQEGFSYGRSMGFVLAMTLFTGFLMGIYQYIAARTFMHAATLQNIDTMMDIYAKMPMFAGQMDNLYEMAHKMMFSPTFRIISEMIGYTISGLFFGLFTSAFARRNPSPFADNSETSINH